MKKLTASVIALSIVSIATPAHAAHPQNHTMKKGEVIIFDGFTVGGTFGVMTNGSKVETNGETQTGPSSTTVAVSTRLGYCFAFGKHGLWLRGGSTYFSSSVEQTQQGAATVKTSLTGLALTTEALFVFGATDTVSFTAGIASDYGVSGTLEQGNTRTDFKILNVGIPLGMIVHF